MLNDFLHFEIGEENNKSSIYVPSYRLASAGIENNSLLFFLNLNCSGNRNYMADATLKYCKHTGQVTVTCEVFLKVMCLGLHVHSSCELVCQISALDISITDNYF